MSKLFERAQQFGKSFMLPIAILPAAGLLLGIGGALSNPNTIKAYPVLDINLLQNIFILMSSAGNIVFQNLPVIFAVGVAIGLAKSDKGTAGLAAMLGFLIMNASMNGLLTITGTLAKDNLAEVGQSMVLGIQTVETGVIGTFFFGFILRLLGPFGLHHIFYLPFWQTALGGSLEVKGHMVQGTQNIFFAQLGDPDVTKYFSGVSRYMSGRFITMMFGLCGAALAIYHTAKPERKKVVGGLMLSAALTSFLTGITEPLEFSFLFVAPILYVIHAFLDGLAFMMVDIFNITVGQTFSGGFIDFLLFGVLQANSKTNFLWVIPVGIIWFMMYYVIFRFLITKFNFKTPGREDETATETVEVTDRAKTIIQALGGKENIDVVDCCATRLRVTLNSDKEVDKAMLTATQSRGVIQKGNGVQIIYGPHVTTIKNEVEVLLENEKL